MGKKNLAKQLQRSKQMAEFDIDVYTRIPKLDNEDWLPLNRELYPQIKPYYWISSKGRVYSTKTNSILSTRHLDPLKHVSPYFKVTLQISIMDFAFSQTFPIHRLMLSTFNPVNGMEELLVNHKDGNKLNDDLSNLEWCTPRENSMHALNHGLYTPIYGEDHCCAKINEGTAKEIIRLLLERRYNQHEIAEKLGTSQSIVSSIATKKAWKHLTRDIDFSSLKYKLPTKFTYPELLKCCEYFEKNEKPENMSVRRHCMNAIVYAGSDKLDEGCINSIRSLYKRERYNYLSKDFHF